MSKYEELIKLIYSFYPQNCSFDEDRYQNSTEYSRYIKRINNINIRNRVSNDIYNEIELVLPQNYIADWKNKDYPSKHFSILLHKGQDILDDDEDYLKY